MAGWGGGGGIPGDFQARGCIIDSPLRCFRRDPGNWRWRGSDANLVEMVAKDKIQVGDPFLSQTPQWASDSSICPGMPERGGVPENPGSFAKQVWPFPSLGSEPPLSGRPGALGSPLTPVTPRKPHRGRVQAGATRVGVAAGLCRGDCTHLMKTFQNGIKQRHKTTWSFADVWAGAGQEKKKGLSMQSWIAETWDILIAWEKGIVRSKAVIRGRLFHHDSAEEMDGHTCRADTPHTPISLISKWETLNPSPAPFPDFLPPWPILHWFYSLLGCKNTRVHYICSCVIFHFSSHSYFYFFIAKYSSLVKHPGFCLKSQPMFFIWL